MRQNSANNYGKYCEGAVAGILWDIFDDVNDDYSTYSWLPPPPPNDSNPDGIGDTLWNGIDNILIALLDRTVNGHHPDNIDEFRLAWFTYPSFGHFKAMFDIWYEHGEPCCNHDGMRGDADGSGSLNVGDPTYLTDYLFFDGPAPPCEEEGDADGSSSINVGDSAYLVQYIFHGGPPPPPCP